jgi:hypothetical protein
MGGWHPMIGWLLGTRLGRTLSAAVAGLLLLLGFIAQQRRDAAQDALSEAQEDDHEHAESIRRAVERDLPDRVREYEGHGYRD